MAITSFQGLRDFINKFLSDHSFNPCNAPHQAFWNTMKYDDFVTGNVPGLTDDTGLPLPFPVPILVKGKSAESNLINILRGNLTLSGVTFPQMPKGGKKMSDPEITEIAGWIDNGCPQ